MPPDGRVLPTQSNHHEPNASRPNQKFGQRHRGDREGDHRVLIRRCGSCRRQLESDHGIDQTSQEGNPPHTPEILRVPGHGVGGTGGPAPTSSSDLEG